MPKTSFLPSVLRTVVPLIYAMLVRAGVVAWVGLDDALWTEALTVLVTGLFYVALRVGERHKAKIGWLLGYAAAPSYKTPAV